MEVARKTIRVNDPLEYNGYAFHQNTFGPAETLQITDPTGKLVWDGPVLLDGELAGKPQGFMTIPGSDLGLLLVLEAMADTAHRPGVDRHYRGRPAGRPTSRS